MATIRDNLIARRDAIGVELAAVTNTDSWEYRQSLYAELQEIDRQLQLISTSITASTPSTAGPFTTIQRGVT